MNIRTALQDPLPPEAFTCLDVKAVLSCPVAPLERGPSLIPPRHGVLPLESKHVCVHSVL